MIGVTKFRIGKRKQKHGGHVDKKYLWDSLRPIIPYPTGRSFRGTLCQALRARLRSVWSLRDALADISQPGSSRFSPRVSTLGNVTKAVRPAKGESSCKPNASEYCRKGRGVLNDRRNRILRLHSLCLSFPSHFVAAVGSGVIFHVSIRNFQSLPSRTITAPQ
jgi:hypothetical protein